MVRVGYCGVFSRHLSGRCADPPVFRSDGGRSWYNHLWAGLRAVGRSGPGEGVMNRTSEPLRAVMLTNVVLPLHVGIYSVIAARGELDIHVV